ncbi:MAG: hypothetical protein K9G41_09760 [Flavobacteriales bacterium]|nr:hypothetical protein [Flavobacteriales bacterium]
MNQDISKLIKDYASVYTRFEKLQEGENEDSELPGGDQKTGVIAEYYAKLYIEQTVGKGQSIGYEQPGAPHDIQYTEEGRKDPVKVQVKAVSAHSKTRTISPIKLKYKTGSKMAKSFDKLYLISLDENFVPDGFWINDYEEIEQKVLINKTKASNKDESKRWKIEGAFMKGESKLHSRKSIGSIKYLNFKNDMKAELIEAIK